VQKNRKVYFIALLSWIGFLILGLLSAGIVRLLVVPFVKKIEFSTQGLTFAFQYMTVYLSGLLTFVSAYYVLNWLLRERLSGKSLKQWFVEVNAPVSPPWTRTKRPDK
jgi:riboflavin transporter FmnP